MLLFNLLHVLSTEHSLSRQSSSGLGAPLVSGEFSTVSIPPVKLEEKERRVNAMAILKLLCECPQLQRHLVELLSARYGELWLASHLHNEGSGRKYALAISN